MKYKHNHNHILQDIALIVLSVLVAIMLVKTDTLSRILVSVQSVAYLGSFLSGMFFTSVFTTAPAIVTLGELAQMNTLLWVALFGALGAVIGDLIIFRFVRDRFSQDMVDLAEHTKGTRRLKALFKMRFFRWMTLLAGGLIIASPLPDELGVGLLGAAHMKSRYFILFSLLFNFIGIMAIGMVARMF